jgi:hypothetical protein
MSFVMGLIEALPNFLRIKKLPPTNLIALPPENVSETLMIIHQALERKVCPKRSKVSPHFPPQHIAQARMAENG